MVEKDGVLDIVVSSLKYPFSNIGTLIKGCIVVLSCLILIGIPLVLGYCIRIYREVMKHNEMLPDWSNPGELISDGISAFIIGIPYAVLIYIVEFMYGSALKDINPVFSGYANVVIGLLLYVMYRTVLFPISSLMSISLMNLAETSDLKKSIDPRNSLKIFFISPIIFAIAYVVAYIIQSVIAYPVNYVMLLAAHNLLYICLLLPVLLWVVFISACIGYYIFARFYRRITRGSASTGINEGVTV